mmetsp:Transcript_133549/g.316573  ORF Transcript_133549/g.316573 Transcript_133549/m.316573 type:complete len:343 (-) Transcript_133549:772-1800(-)
MEAAGRCKLLTIQGGQRLPREDHGHRVLHGHHRLPHLQALIGVAGPEDEEPRDAAEGAELLHRLMRRPVLAHADGVVREDEDGGHLHERCHADGRPHVVAEDQEGGAKGPQLAQRQPVHDGPHGVLPDAKMQVPAPEVAPAAGGGQKVRLFGQRREAGGGEVRGAADQPGQALGHGVQAGAGGLARGQALGVRGEGLAEAIPVLRQLAVQHGLQQGALLGILHAVRGQHLLPVLPLRTATLQHLLPEVAYDFFRHQELLIRPVVDVLGCGDLLLAQRSAVRMKGVLHRGGTPRDVGVHHDQGGPVLLTPEAQESSCERFHIVCIPHAKHIPTIGHKTRSDIF